MATTGYFDFQEIAIDLPQVFALGIFGTLAIDTAQDLRRPLFDAVDRPEITDVIIDAENLHYIDSSGIGLFYAAAIKLRQKRGALHLVSAKATILKILRMTRFEELVQIHETFAVALQSCKRIA